MKNSDSAQYSGVGFPGLLAILFIGLKLGHVIEWPWLWVLSPLWIPLAIVLVVLFGCFVGYLVSSVIIRMCDL